ncbi:MAG: Unknown protein [uncultured Aureispira sp.]|uniref:Uncharacterized protein n=1 Tax=uncultured Aureispira sp. TaxID=1331704 RepID=A0A6S6RWB5_9BACT|nr:MAG: Unknown protein [uncultured Aureispira sp.]
MNQSSYSNKLLFISLFCLFLSHFCLGQVSKKTYQTILANNVDLVKIHIEGANVEVKETKGSRILVETVIRLSVPNEALLNFVIKNGRYTLVQTQDESRRELLLEVKKDKNVILVKGEACTEQVTYTIYVPSFIKALKT